MRAHRPNPKTRRLLLAEENARAARAAYSAWERVQEERPLKRVERTEMVAARNAMRKAEKELVAARKRPVTRPTPGEYVGWAWQTLPGSVAGYFVSAAGYKIVPSVNRYTQQFDDYTVIDPDGRVLGTRKAATLVVELAEKDAARRSGYRFNPRRAASRTDNPKKQKRAKRGYQIQAFLLDADKFSLKRAKSWLKKWGHKADDVILRGGVYYAEQYPSHEFYEQTLHPALAGIAKNVDAIIGKPQPETEAAGAPADRRKARQQQALFPRKRVEAAYIPDPEFGF